MNIIATFVTSSGYETNLITDSQLSCSYQEIPPLFLRMDRVFGEWNIEKDACFAFECDNSVPSALTLLYLFERGYNVLLLPKIAISSGRHQPTLPKFCRYKLVTSAQVQGDRLVDLSHPQQFLQLLDNPQWSQGAHQETQKLYLQTSGSTGSPKMVMHSHTQLRGNVLNCVRRLNLQSGDRVALPVPIYHMYGLGAGFLPSVAVGASIDLQQGANLLRYLQREQKFQPNVAFMTPIFAQTLLKGRRSDRGYKLTVAAGDSITPETFTAYEARMGNLVKLYGSTEMGAIAAANAADAPAIRTQTIGKPLSGVQLRLQTPAVDSIQDMKDVGELWCHHDYGFEGYVDENGQSIDLSPSDRQDGWFRTKDLAKINTDGYLDVLGRCDHSVNRDGLLVFFADVEKAIRTLAEIDTVVVVSHGRSQRGKGIVAYCVLTQGSHLTEATIRTACFDVLPKRAIPDDINVVNALPLLPNGKVDRRKLMAMSAEKSSIKV